VKNKKQCKFCTSTKCVVRICTRGLTYDEVACRSHFKDLERDADAVLGSPGTPRLHWQGIGSPVERGENMDDVFDGMESLSEAEL